jgi:glucose repression regulatory protein TUP1
VRLWEIRTGQLVDSLLGHKDSVVSVAFTPDGNGLISGGADGR